MERITLKANTSLLRAIVAANPELEIELSKAVLSNVKDDIIKDALVNRITAHINELSLNFPNTAVAKNAVEFKKLVRQYTQELVKSDEIATLVVQTLTDKIKVQLKQVTDSAIRDFNNQLADILYGFDQKVVTRYANVRPFDKQEILKELIDSGLTDEQAETAFNLMQKRING